MQTKNLGIPMIYTKEGQTTLSFDIYSQLLNNRIIMLDDEINNHSASVVVAQLLYLNSLSDEQIDLYINSPGGCVSSGLSIIDTMNFIKAPVSTICTGMAASMAAVILACGEKDLRRALPHSEVMIHQPLGGANGQASNIEIAAKHILSTKKNLYEILSKATGKSVKVIEKDADRDYYMSALDAKDYGIVDEVIPWR